MRVVIAELQRLVEHALLNIVEDLADMNSQPLVNGKLSFFKGVAACGNADVVLDISWADFYPDRNALKLIFSKLPARRVLFAAVNKG